MSDFHRTRACVAIAVSFLALLSLGCELDSEACDPETDPGCESQMMPTVTCANFNQQNLEFLQCSFDEETETCRFFIRFSDGSVEKTCRQHCEGIVGGTCVSSADEVSDTGDGRCQESVAFDCDESFSSAICSCVL